MSDTTPESETTWPEPQPQPEHEPTHPSGGDGGESEGGEQD